MSTNNKREFKHYIFSLDENNNCIFTIFNKDKNKPIAELIPLIRNKKGTSPYAFNTYLGIVPFDFTLNGEEYHKGDLIECDLGTGSKYTYTVIKNPLTDNFYNTFLSNPLSKILYDNTLALYNKLIKGSKSIKESSKESSEESWLMQGFHNSIDSAKLVLSNSVNSSNSSNSDSLNSSDSSSSSITDTDSTPSTRSFDFLDDILGTQKEASKDKTAELDPNQIANTIVNETKLNDTAISSLVSTYLNSLHRINRSYNTQTK